jgi:hypothetical protein
MQRVFDSVKVWEIRKFYGQSVYGVINFVGCVADPRVTLWGICVGICQAEQCIEGFVEILGGWGTGGG